MRLFRRPRERFAQLRARGEHQRALLVGFARPTTTLLLRLGLLQAKGPITVERFAYRVYWWLMFVVVLTLTVVLNPGPGEATIYFGALLALIFGWLFAIPQVAQMLGSFQLAPGTPWGDVVRELFNSLRHEKLSLPDLSPAEEAELSKVAERLVPPSLPLALLQIVFNMSVRAIVLAAVAILGLLVGSRVAAVSWWPGFSPIVFAYAATVPDALAMLASLTIPVFAQTVVAALRVEAAASQLAGEAGDPEKPGPAAT